jgi:hypothetical protein
MSIHKHLNAMIDVDKGHCHVVSKQVEFQGWRKAHGYQINCCKYPHVERCRPRLLKPSERIAKSPVMNVDEVDSKIYLTAVNCWKIRLALLSEQDPENNHIELERIQVFNRSVQPLYGDLYFSQKAGEFKLTTDDYKLTGVVMSHYGHMSREDFVYMVKKDAGLPTGSKEIRRRKGGYLKRVSTWFKSKRH